METGAFGHAAGPGTAGRSKDRPARLRRVALALPLIILLSLNLLGSSSNLARLRDFGSFVASGQAASVGL